MCATAELPATDSTATCIPETRITGGVQPLPRRRKETLLPQINDLALEGHSCREIAARLGLCKSTVNRWLQELRQERLANVADSAEMIAVALARYDALYREAMEGWRRSQTDKEVRRSEETETARGSKKKRSVRTENRAGNPAFLARAQGAVDGLCKLLTRIGPPQSKVEAPDGEPIPAEALEEDDLPNMTIDELRAVEAACAAEIERREKAAEPPLAQKPRRLLTKRHKRCRKQVALIPWMAPNGPGLQEKGRKSSGISMEWDPLKPLRLRTSNTPRMGNRRFLRGFAAGVYFLWRTPVSPSVVKRSVKTWKLISLVPFRSRSPVSGRRPRKAG